MREILCNAKITDGKLVIFERDLLNNQIARQKDQDVVISIKTRYRKRSLSQNNSMWWYMDMISKETGIEPEAIKEVLQLKFLQVPVLNEAGDEIVDESTGEVFTKIQGTSKLSTVEFNDFMDKIRNWALEFLNMVLPEPNDQGELNFDK